MTCEYLMMQKWDKKRTIEVYFEHSSLWEMKTVSGEKKFCSARNFSWIQKQIAMIQCRMIFSYPKRYVQSLNGIRFKSLSKTIANFNSTLHKVTFKANLPFLWVTWKDDISID